MNELALFAGAGGGILASKRLGWRTICGVERDAYAAGVLAQRQNDGSLAPFPIWSDVTTFDGTRWRGRVDVISGGFPCQDISCAGSGAGIDGARSGMWVEMARIIREVGPWVVFVENSPMLTSRGLGRVLGDLAALGFDAEWGVLGAADVGANHQRDRIWIVAYSNKVISRQRSGWFSERREHCGSGETELADANELGRRKAEKSGPWCENSSKFGDDGKKESLADSQGIHAQGFNNGSWEVQSRGEGWWAIEPDVGRVANGVAFRVDRLKAIGNGQVPECAAEAYRQLTDRIK